MNNVIKFVVRLNNTRARITDYQRISYYFPN